MNILEKDIGSFKKFKQLKNNGFINYLNQNKYLFGLSPRFNLRVT